MRNVLLVSVLSLTAGCLSLEDLLDLWGHGGGGHDPIDTGDQTGGDTGTPVVDTGSVTVDTGGGGGSEPGVVSPGGLDDVILDCDTDAGYQVDTVLGDEGAPALWLASVYETHSNHGAGNHPMGEASVFFDLPGDNVLALSSYEPVTWNITLGERGSLSKVVVFGYHEQVVVGVDVPVEIYGAPYCGYSYPYNGGGCDTDELFSAVQDATGLTLSRFDGCYTASEFQFVADDVVQPDPDAVPCGPGETVELTYAINAETMQLGASDGSGAGACTGRVTFFDDLADVGQAVTWDHATNSRIDSPYNGSPESCNAVHCNDVVYGDERVQEEYCSLYAICEDGFARATGFTW